MSKLATSQTLSSTHLLATPSYGQLSTNKHSEAMELDRGEQRLSYHQNDKDVPDPTLDSAQVATTHATSSELLPANSEPLTIVVSTPASERPHGGDGEVQQPPAQMCKTPH